MPTGIYIRTEVTRLALSISHRGKKPWITGRKHTEATKQKIKVARAKQVISQGTKDKLRIIMLSSKRRPPILPISLNPRATGKTWELSEEVKTALSNARKGENNPAWRGGITPINNSIRRSAESRKWKKDVLLRDNFTCVFCGYKGRNLHVDHIKPFALYPELRFELSNGRTLCMPCHKKTPTYGKKLNQLIALNRATFEDLKSYPNRDWLKERRRLEYDLKPTPQLYE